jgi:hypothetical protein
MADTSEALKDIFDEMFTLLEDLETRNVAVLEYLREQGGVTDQKLAPYLDRAGAASNVKWRAARVRMEYLLAPAPKSTTEHGKDEKGSEQQETPKSKSAKQYGSNAERRKSSGEKSGGEDQNTEKQAASLAEPVQQLDGKESSSHGDSNDKKDSNEGKPQAAATQGKSPEDKTSSDDQKAAPSSGQAASGKSEARSKDSEAKETDSKKSTDKDGSNEDPERSNSASTR